MSIRLIIFLFFAAGLYACNFEPDGVNPVEKARPDTAPVPFSFGTEDDTLYLYGERQVLSFIYPNDERMREITFSFNNNESSANYHYASGQVGNLELDASNLSDGIYPLTARITVASGTGSLADVSGVELITSIYQWVVVVQKSKPATPEIVSVAPHQGSLQITWEAYPRRDFVKYRLIRLNYHTNNYYREGEELTVINDQQQTTYLDTSYVGGEVTYVLLTEISSIYERYYYGENTVLNDLQIYSDLLPAFYPNQKQDQKVVLSWSKCRYDANFSSYRLYRRYSNYNSEAPTLVATLDNVNDTTYEIINPEFGGEVLYQLYVNASYENNNYDNSANVTELLWGEQGQSFETSTYVPANQSVYLTGYGPVLRIDETTHRTEATLESYNNVGFTVSANGQRAYLIQRYNLYQVDPITMTSSNGQSVDNLLTYVEIPTNVQVSNNNFLFVEGYNQGYQNDYTLEIIDMENGLLFSHIPGGATQNETLLVSPDGQYFTYNQSVYQIANGGVSLIGNLAIQGDYSLHLLPGEAESFMVINQDEVTVIRWRDAQNQRTFSLSQPLEQTCVDAKTGYIGGQTGTQNNRQYNIYDSSGNLVRQIPVFGVTNDYDKQPSYYLYNSTLFSTRGFYLSLTF